MRVLSLFDGMSCGQIALKEIGITPEVYYASEIDKFAIKQTQLNFPNTIQVGDVRDLNVEDLGHIDLILAGSPCTDMSFSGKRKGLSTVEGIEIKSLNEYLELKKQGFEFAGQSYLFWEFIRILNDVRKTNPDVLFLLENVKMGKKWEPVFDDAIGCKGNHIFVWITDTCLQDGKIRKVKAKIEDYDGTLLADTPGRFTPYTIGYQAFKSKEEALKYAEEQRTDLIKSLKLQIHELENLKFEYDD